MCRTAKFKFVHDAMGDDLDVRAQSSASKAQLKSAQYHLQTEHHAAIVSWQIGLLMNTRVGRALPY
eukprot:COSAG02_NODE_73_length_41919_cov_6.571066_38_plen_66_part_00